MVAALGEREAPHRVPASDFRLFAARRQLLPGKLADRFQHPEPGLARPIVHAPQEAAVNERSDEIEGVESRA